MSTGLLDNRAEHYRTHGSVTIGNCGRPGELTVTSRRYLSQADADVLLGVDMPDLFLSLQLSPAGALALGHALVNAGITAMEVNEELRALRAAHWGQQ